MMTSALEKTFFFALQLQSLNIMCNVNNFLLSSKQQEAGIALFCSEYVKHETH